MADSFDPNMMTAPFQLTKSMHRDVYPAVDPKNPNLRVEGKVVVVAGAGGGLGYAIAKAWSEAGAKGVVLVGRDAKKLETVAADLKAETTLVAPGDVAVEADIESIFTKTVEKFGGVDAVINSTGAFNGALLGRVEPSQWWKDCDVNLKAVLNLFHYFVKANNGKGTFINLVSLGGLLLIPGLSSYSVPMLAAMKLGEYIDLEMPDIRMFSIHPGIVEAENGRGAVVDSMTPFAKDKQALTAGLTLYVAKPEADFLRGGFVSANWDVEEMKKHEKEITEKKLLKLTIGAKLGPTGHPWE